jgi:hypothetical protein
MGAATDLVALEEVERAKTGRVVPLRAVTDALSDALSLGFVSPSGVDPVSPIQEFAALLRRAPKRHR